LKQGCCFYTPSRVQRSCLVRMLYRPPRVTFWWRTWFCA
jgi:hypothetical protein